MPLCWAQKAEDTVCYAKSWHGSPLAVWSSNPILCLGGTRLSLTTGSGRSQPGWRRPHLLRHRRAGSGRTRKGSSPPRHTVRREMSKAAWGEKLPLSGSLLGLVKVLLSLPNSDRFFCSCFIFAMSHILVLQFVCLFLLH